MTGRSSCPECGTILRIRDRSFVGRRVNCPECQATLQIESTDDKGQFVTRRVSNAEPRQFKSNPPNAQPASEKKNSTRSSLWSSIVRFVYSPLTAAWLLALAVSVMIGILALSPKFRFAQVRPTPVNSEQKSEEVVEPIVEAPTVVKDAAPMVQELEKVVPRDNEPTMEISALEPANLDGPLLPPLPPMKEKPPPVVVVKPPVKKDIPGMMRQPITEYRQRKVRRRDLLEALQEQLGAPIRYDAQDLGEDKLDETVAFELVDTTIGDVIKTVADSAHWEIAVEDTGIRLEGKRE